MEKLIKQNMIDTLRTCAEDVNMNIQPYDVTGFKTFFIGEIRIVKENNVPVLYLEDGVSSSYITEWKKDVGGILLKDLKFKKYDNLFEVVGDNFKALVRRIPEDELEDRTSAGFNHFTYGDYSYTILRYIEKHGAYSFKELNLPKEPVCEFVEEETDNYKYSENEELNSLPLYDE